jgi:mono/diheme cytochrome c family protein
VVELHRFEDAHSGFKTTQLPKLMRSSDRSFRPVDVGVGPDGALYLADWFNPIIGHYQASYADPKRDKAHGRIWRITAKGRPPVKQPNLAAMSAKELLDQLHSPERWTRYQAKRLLFDMPDAGVVPIADAWVAALSPQAPDYERLLLEVAGVFEAHEAVRPALLAKLSAAKDPRVRAYAARVTGAWAAQLPDTLELLQARVRDENPRVRLEAVVAASYLPRPESVRVVTMALESKRDPFMEYAMRQSARALQRHWGPALVSAGTALAGTDEQMAYLKNIAGAPPAIVSPGLAVYEAACLACHQPGGKGLAGVYPPLAGSDWVKGDAARLIKILLHGLSGPLRVGGQLYGGENAVPMPGMAGLSDEQIAEVLSYIRAEFGGGTPAVSASEVRAVREATGSRDKPWTVAELEPR